MKSLMAQQSIRFALVNRERGTTMNRETLSNYGWIVICVLFLAVMIALAPVFADAIKTAVTNAYESLIDKGSEAISYIDSVTVA